MTVFDSKGEPFLDSEEKQIVENYDHSKEVKDDYKLTSSQIAKSIRDNDFPGRNSLVKIKYKGQDCLAQFSWYNVPDLEGEIWKPVTKDDHKTMDAPISETYEYYVSDMERFKFVVRSTQNARIKDFRGQERPSIKLMGKNLYFYRVVALVFHPEQLKAKIAELKIAKQKDKFGNDYTFATLEVDHIDFKPKNNCANNLQFLTPQENIERSHSRPCRIWEVNSDTKTKYPSLATAAKEMGYNNASSVHTILKNNTHKKWRGEYIVKIG
jgi:hypothetical protein